MKILYTEDREEENEFLHFFTKDEFNKFKNHTEFATNHCLVITKEYYFEIICSVKDNDLTIFWMSNDKSAETNTIDKNTFLNLLQQCTMSI